MFVLLYIFEESKEPFILFSQYYYQILIFFELFVGFLLMIKD